MDSQPGPKPGTREASRSRSLPSRAAIYFMSIYFLLAFSELVPVAPLVKLFERSLCIAYYEDQPDIPSFGEEIPEELCRIAEIQSLLATIRGWKSTLDTVPVLVAIPFAKLSERLGLRTVMTVCLIGIILSYIEIFLVCAYPRVLPLRLVLASSSFLLIGGSFPSAISTMWAMASSSIPASGRSDTFNFIFAGFYLAELVGSLFSALTTDVSAWIPCGASILSLFACLIQLRFPPDADDHLSYTPAPTDPLLNDDDPPAAADLHADNPPPSPVAPRPEGGTCIPAALQNRNVMILLPAFFTGSLRYTILALLVQYNATRFGRKISEGAYFYTEAAVVNVLLFLVLVPALLRHLRDARPMQPGVLELRCVQFSLVLLALGAWLIGLAASSLALWCSVAVFAAGFGSKVFLLSLISRWATDRGPAVLYAAVTVFQTLGHAVGDPALQAVYAATLRAGASAPALWWGMPFFVSSAMYLVSALLTGLVRV